MTIGIANNPETPLLAAAEFPILLNTGAGSAGWLNTAESWYGAENMS